MTTKSIPDSKAATTAAPVASGDCCGGKTHAESRHEISKLVDQDDVKRAASGNATDSCCCGNTQEVKP